MKVNSVMVVMAMAIVVVTTGCCWLGCESCKKEGGKCCAKKCCIDLNASAGGASAGAGVGTSGVHAEAKLGK